MPLAKRCRNPRQDRPPRLRPGPARRDGFAGVLIRDTEAIVKTTDTSFLPLLGCTLLFSAVSKCPFRLGRRAAPPTPSASAREGRRNVRRLMDVGRHLREFGELSAEM